MGVNEDKLDHQLDAERAVVGSLLIDESIAPALLSEVRLEDFASSANKLIYAAAKQLLRTGSPVDPITVRSQIGEQYSDYLVQLMDVTPTSANWREYARIMKAQAALRRVQALADKLMLSVTMEDCRPVIADLQQLVAGRQTMSAWTMQEGLDDFFRAQDPDAPAPQYIKTGFDFLDEAIFLSPGSVVVLAGEPSSGKTAMALEMAYRMAEDHKVGFFSLETDKEKVRDRLIASAHGVDLRDIKLRVLRDQDWQAIARNSKDYVGRSLVTLEASGMDGAAIEAVSQAYGFDVVFTDYAQLIEPFDGRTNRTEQMRAVSQYLHTFAQRTKTMVVELAQLSRPAKDQKGAWEPSMHDNKESGQFEQDADLILMLWDPNTQKAEYDYNRVLKVAKNKEGPRGRWPLDFNGKVQQFQLHPDKNMAVNEYVSAGKAAKAQRQVQPGQMTLLPGKMTQEEMARIFPADQGGF